MNAPNCFCLIIALCLWTFCVAQNCGRFTGSHSCDSLNCGYCNSANVQDCCPELCRQCASNSQIARSGGTNNRAIGSSGSSNATDSSGNKFPEKQQLATDDQLANPDKYFPVPEAQKMFTTCCDQFITPERCMGMCVYNVTKEQIWKLAYPPPTYSATFDPDVPENCSFGMMNRIMYCSAQGNDNTQCCEDKGIFKKYPQCRPWCMGLPEIKIYTLEYYACFENDVLNAILRCNHKGVMPLLGTPPYQDVATPPKYFQLNVQCAGGDCKN